MTKPIAGHQEQPTPEPQKGVVETILPGLSLSKILGDVGAELGRLGTQGSAELASALFNGTAYVAYGEGQKSVELDNPIDPKQPEIERDERAM